MTIISGSVCHLQYTLWCCERELSNLDMAINYSKSCRSRTLVSGVTCPCLDRVIQFQNTAHNRTSRTTMRSNDLYFYVISDKTVKVKEGRVKGMSDD